ncbi:MAG: hypothetical protein ACOZEN_10655 [Thermodesulfobacteriota bacterium]
MKKLYAAAAFAAGLILAGGAAQAQTGSYMECTACQLVLGMVDASTGDGGDIAVDARKQCALLPDAADRASCEMFYAQMGPKFIKALKARRSKGESLESVCGSMGYCR